MKKGERKINNPIRAFFYVRYLELFEFGTPLDIKLFDARLFDLELPLKMMKWVYQAKHKAKYCEDRVKELKLLYALVYVDGYQVKTSKLNQFLAWESKDPLKKESAMENTRLFSSARAHVEAENLIIERRT